MIQDTLISNVSKAFDIEIKTVINGYVISAWSKDNMYKFDKICLDAEMVVSAIRNLLDGDPLKECIEQY
jgi:hypothetical protein